MSVFKCKMCGGTIEFEQGATVGVCDSCGTKQTLPRLDNDKKANLYDRANHFRRNNEFDKAMGIYEQILNEDNTDAEAYWSLVLCRYGIEYVEDPSSHKRIPTVNRAQFTSIFDDDNYKSALQYADGYQRSIYEEEAKAINEIQKGILEISNKEEPFDVFICYKETDNSGRRTPDSVLANDLYHQLTQEGFKVFFARITLEDKLGSAYEPYIFAALNSSKVMVVLGTKPEYFNAVWVKNEWSRYLALVKQSGGKKVLIPAYRDMDPYDLPEEFSHLQAQDMSKLGFMQDLIRGIKKIAQADTAKTTVKETVVVNGGNANTAPLLKRVFIFLEDGNWQEADEYCEKVLDLDPECAEAYLGKLMAELHINRRGALADCEQPFDKNNNYQKVVRFADESLKNELAGFIEQINIRSENARLNDIYTRAKNAMATANTENTYKEAARLFETAGDYEDSASLAQECFEKAEIAKKDEIIAEAKYKMTHCTVASYKSAIELLESVSGFNDVDELICTCRNKIEEIETRQKAERLEAQKKAKRNKRIAVITTPIVCAIIAFIIVLNTVITTERYNRAVEKYGKEWADIVKNASVGGTITFGTYEQDNNTSNGKEAIEWTVLDKNGMSLLLISKQALDCQPYNTSETDVTWENCSLREWMNGTFINNAFSEEEQAKIQSTNVSADKNPKYDTDPGNATTDKVFLLSITEAEKYFEDDASRRCAPTAYAEAQGAYTIYGIGSGDACWWWLRSPGKMQFRAAYVSNDVINDYGSNVNYVCNCVRPALWINLDS